ncbi:MAG: hypothetical protein LBL74_00900 [Bacteroidales bacterium]|jgi:nucleoid DNA-binding protein|nr:hypothetical protein [Bacteroidales bacterium]
MNVASNLFEYLKQHDKAELTGFGTFNAITHRAEYDEANKLITPPKKTLEFSKEETNNMDFVLFMAKREFISEQTALTWIKQYSDSLKERLATAKSFLLPSLGTISIDEEGNYRFEALKDIDLMDETFGLDTVENVKTFEFTKEEPIESDQTQVEETENKPLETVSVNNEAPISVQDAFNAHMQATRERTMVTELASDSNNDDDIVDLVDSIRETADKILVVTQRMKDEQTMISAGGKRKSKTSWKWVAILLLFLFIGSFSIVGSYYMGWLQDYKWAKPISKTLSAYIMTRSEIKKQSAEPVHLAATPTVETESATAAADTMINNITLEQESAPIAQNTPKRHINKVAKKKAKDTTSSKEDQKQNEIDFSTIIQMRPTNKLGYDVIATTATERMRAEYNARKAQSLGYDGYVIARQRRNVPIYYVSYGSRNTLKEAKDLMQSMIDSLGGDYYIIARGETKN